MIGSAQINAAIGPGLETAEAGSHLSITGITKVELDLAREVCTVFYADSKVTEFSLVGITGLSTTITGVTGSAVSFEID